MVARLTAPRAAALALSTLAASAHAGAEPAASAPPSDPALSVEVKGHYDARRDDTASKTVIGQGEITRYGDTSLIEVFKRLPGVSVSGGQVRMRGLGAGYTQILLNGQKTPAGFAIESLPPHSIDKIEIIRSATAENSTQAIAGTLNIITKKTVRKAQRSGTASLGTDTGGLTPYATLQDAGRHGVLSHTVTLAMSQSRFDSPSFFAQRDADAAGALTASSFGQQDSHGKGSSVFLTPRLHWNLPNGDTISSHTLIRRMLNDAASSERVQAFEGQPPAFLESANSSAARTSIFSTTTGWIHQFGAGSKIDLKLGVSSTVRSNDSQFAGWDGAPLPALQRSADGRSRDDELTFAGKHVSALAGGHTVVAGWDAASHRKMEERRQVDRTAAGNSVLDEEFRVRVNRVALFAQDEWNLRPHWSAYLGLRWEGVQTHSEGSAMGTGENRSSVFSPIAQTLWKLPGGQGSQLRLALARTYKAPALGSLSARRVIAVDNTAATPDFQGNPGLRPELAWGLDTAFEFIGAEGDVFSVSAHYRRIDDVIASRLRFIAGRWVSMPDNEGQAVSRGIELEARFGLHRFIVSAPAIDVRFGASRNWSSVSTVPGPDNRLANQVPASVSLGLDYLHTRSGVKVGGDFSLHTAGLMQSSKNELQYASAQRNLDVYGAWKFSRQGQVRLALSNLLYRPTYASSLYRDASGSVMRSQDGRTEATARLSLEYSFL